MTSEYSELIIKYVKLRDEIKEVEKQLKEIKKHRIDDFRIDGVRKDIDHGDIIEEYHPPRKYYRRKKEFTEDRIRFDHPEYYEEVEGYEQIKYVKKPDV
jgi:hypothetical protein